MNESVKKHMEKLCWSFCTDKCALKKHGLCPSEIPPYRSPPPNDGCTSISELRFGKRDYEDMEIEYWRKISKIKFHSFQKRVSMVPHWRSELKGIDSHAMMHIYTDPKLYEETKNTLIGTGESIYTRKNKFPSIHPSAWNPNLLQDILLDDIKLLELIMNGSGSTHNINSHLPSITRRINHLFEEVLIEKFIKEIEEIKSRKLISDERKEEFDFVLKRLPINTNIFKEKGSLIVAKFLIELHFTVPEFWMTRVSEMNTEEVNLPDTYSKTGGTFILDSGEKEQKKESKLHKVSSEIEWG